MSLGWFVFLCHSVFVAVRSVPAAICTAHLFLTLLCGSQIFCLIFPRHPPFLHCYLTMTSWVHWSFLVKGILFWRCVSDLWVRYNVCIFVSALLLFLAVILAASVSTPHFRFPLLLSSRWGDPRVHPHLFLLHLSSGTFGCLHSPFSVWLLSSSLGLRFEFSLFSDLFSSSALVVLFFNFGPLQFISSAALRDLLFQLGFS